MSALLLDEVLLCEWLDSSQNSVCNTADQRSGDVDVENSQKVYQIDFNTYNLLGLNLSLSREKQYSLVKKMFKDHIVSKNPKTCTLTVDNDAVIASKILELYPDNSLIISIVEFLKQNKLKLEFERNQSTTSDVVRTLPAVTRTILNRPVERLQQHDPNEPLSVGISKRNSNLHSGIKNTKIIDVFGQHLESLSTRS